MGGGFLDKNKHPRSKKITLIFIILLVAIGLVIGISYAFWTSKAGQEDINLISSDCLKIELTDVSSGIELQSTYPIRDEEAESLKPYTFTIKNACSTSVYYKVNLEIMEATNRLNSKYIAIDINNTGKKLLSDYTSVDPTYKDENYIAVEARELIQSGSLNGGASVSYNIKLWMDESVTINDDAMNKIFKSKINVTASQETFKPVLATYITDLSRTDTTNLTYDDTKDSNLRYIGSDPDNYLCFDKDCTNGKWRVIGIMNNISTADGVTKSLVKIIRATSIGSYAWDSNGVNDWTTASLNTFLNGDWYSSNLKDYDNLVESVVWKLGGYSSTAITTSTFYAYERNTIVYGDNPTTWDGKIALMYPSDYGYATSGGDTERDTCLTYNLNTWSSYRNCYGNDFLYLSSDEWTLMQHSSGSNAAFYVIRGGNVYNLSVPHSVAVRPVGYLKSNTQILSGSGTSDDPWIIGIE